jgi:hypothetical protein
VILQPLEQLIPGQLHRDGGGERLASLERPHDAALRIDRHGADATAIDLMKEPRVVQLC